MRLTVTPIGAAGSSTATVAAAVVEYLEGAQGDPGAGLLSGSTRDGGAVAYYADSIEVPAVGWGRAPRSNVSRGSSSERRFSGCWKGGTPIPAPGW